VENRTFGRSRFRWEDNIKTDVRMKGCGLEPLDPPATEIFDHGDEPSDCIKRWECFDLLSKLSASQ
jgi:hypothetical protein